MTDKVTITVDRADLDRVLNMTTGHPYEGTPVEHAANRIRAAIPEPPWEPSEAMVEACPELTGYHARRHLIALHDAGFDLTLREDPQ